MERNYDEIAVISLLKPILEINAEDKQKKKELQAENERLARIANEYIAQCEELTETNRRLIEENERLRVECKILTANRKRT